MGSPVGISHIEELRISLTGEWEARLFGVSVRGTLRGDQAPAAHLGKVELRGRLFQIGLLMIRGGRLELIRLGKAQKNFRFFPKRGGKRRVQTFCVYAESLQVHLSNFPPGVFFYLTVGRLSGRIVIDSLLVRICEGRAALLAHEVCVAGVKQPFPHAVSFGITGHYNKIEDVWFETKLHLEALEGVLHFQGDIQRWETPIGHVGGYVRRSLLDKLPSRLANWLVDSLLYFSGEVRGLCYEARLEGKWRFGYYDVCIGGERDELSQVEGHLAIGDWGHFGLRGSLERLYAFGKLSRSGWTAALSGIVNLRASFAELLVQDTLGGWLALTGNFRRWAVRGQLGLLPFQGEWYHERGLRVQIDTVEAEMLQSVFRSYAFLLGGGQALSADLRARVVHFEQGMLSDVQLRSSARRLVLRANASFNPFPTQATLYVQTDPSLGQGTLAIESAEGFLNGEWRRDTLSLSLVVHWQDVWVELAGKSDLSSRCLWVERAEAVFPSGERIAVRGILTLDGASVDLAGAVPVSWLLFHLPLTGVEVWEGRLHVNLCAQGTWDTLLRWDNPSEGFITLEGVRGSFRNLGLPIRTLAGQLSYIPDLTTLHWLRGEIGSLAFHAEGEVIGALSYLYTDWYRLQGRLHVSAEHLVVSEFWRRVERQKVQPQVRFPSNMEAQITLDVRDVDLLGLPAEGIEASARIQGLTAQVDSFRISYGGTFMQGWAHLDLQDSSCYLVSGKLRVRDLPIERLLRDMELSAIPTFERIGLRGRFSGYFQANLRFTPDIAWLRQSSLHAEGSISAGKIRTPRFMRWLRPYYLSAYKDSIDFYANIPLVSITDGFMRISDALLLTRIIALEVSGYHLLPKDRFLYRIQAVRVRRRTQRYPDLETLGETFAQLIDRSLGLIYVEKKEDGKILWRYPWRYSLRRLLSPRRVL
ncbi:MAG: hypothetical protein N3E49_08580 [Bacteroidia bacterium]|nr:hypothetical protein [Bacteroidia bacterium]